MVGDIRAGFFFPHDWGEEARVEEREGGVETLRFPTSRHFLDARFYSHDVGLVVIEASPSSYHPCLWRTYAHLVHHAA